MHKIYLAALLLVFLSCSQRAAQPSPVAQPASVPSVLVLDSTTCSRFNICLKPITVSYSAARNTVTQRRVGLTNLATHVQAPMDTLADSFTDLYLNTILPYWYDTPWAFSGYTAVPKEGEIACGYFVSTTLLHMGVPLNRYKIAQQNPLNEAKTYAAGDSIYQFTSAETALAKMHTADFAAGFYFLGLGDNHVGLLLKRADEIFFLHSNYIDGKVVIEPAATSRVFASYTMYYVVNLSYNNNFINHWLKQQPLAVVTD